MADQVEMNEMGGHVVLMRGKKRCIQGFGGEKPEGKRPLGRPRRKWEYNMKKDFQGVGWGHGLD